MKRVIPCLALVLAFPCLTLAACAGEPAVPASEAGVQAAASVAPSAAVEEGPLDAAARQSIEHILAEVRENSYSSLSFSSKTQTIAIGEEGGRAVSQSVQTNMAGELDLQDDEPRMHFSYETRSTGQPKVYAYDMYVDASGAFVEQDGQIYLVNEETTDPESYIDSIAGIASEESVGKLLDAANRYKIERGDATVITVSVDAAKATETGLVEEESLPQGASVATLVASYVVSPNKRLETVRLMSSTSGKPTYRVSQTYRFADYDTADLPEWPDLDEYAAQGTRLQTDENGNSYLMDEEGNRHFVESIDADGTVHFAPSSSDAYYYESASGTAGGSSGSAARGGSGDSSASGSTGLGEPQIMDDSSTGMGEPVIYDDGE